MFFLHTFFFVNGSATAPNKNMSSPVGIPWVKLKVLSHHYDLVSLPERCGAACSSYWAWCELALAREIDGDFMVFFLLLLLDARQQHDVCGSRYSVYSVVVIIIVRPKIASLSFFLFFSTFLAAVWHGTSRKLFQLSIFDTNPFSQRVFNSVRLKLCRSSN